MRLHALKRRLNEVHRNNGLVQQQHCNDQLALVHAWIQLASSPRTCPLLLGGFDELCSPLSSSCSSRNLSVQVRVPLSARQVDSKRGYIRFPCDLFDLSAHIIESNLEGGHAAPLQQEQVLLEYQDDHENKEASRKHPNGTRMKWKTTTRNSRHGTRMTRMNVVQIRITMNTQERKRNK